MPPAPVFQANCTQICTQSRFLAKENPCKPLICKGFLTVRETGLEYVESCLLSPPVCAGMAENTRVCAADACENPRSIAPIAHKTHTNCTHAAPSILALFSLPPAVALVAVSPLFRRWNGDRLQRSFPRCFPRCFAGLFPRFARSSPVRRAAQTHRKALCWPLILPRGKKYTPRPKRAENASTAVCARFSFL